MDSRVAQYGRRMPLKVAEGTGEILQRLVLAPRPKRLPREMRSYG